MVSASTKWDPISVHVRLDLLGLIARQISTSVTRYPARMVDSALMDSIPSGVSAHRDSMDQHVKTIWMNVQQTRARMVPLAKTESALSIVNVSKTMTESCVNQVIVCSPKGSYSTKTVLLHCSVVDPGFLKRRVPTGRGWSAPISYLAIFCRKLHENENTWTRGVPLIPLHIVDFSAVTIQYLTALLIRG